MSSSEKFAVLGLGYVGLPVALALAEQFGDVVGFDISNERIQELKSGHDRTGETEPGELERSSLKFSADAGDLKDRTFYIVTVPTPIDENRQPRLEPLRKACELIGPLLQKGDLVVFESTVYPGLTEEICGPWLERHANLKAGTDFKLGYAPERMNPGDKEHTLQKIIRVVAGQDAETLERVARVYDAIVPAGVHRATSIRVAEAAKVIENTQRDLNIALMNELAVIFDRLGLRTKDVLDAARTKWNFLPFSPGLVGGHCIGVDPYYLTSKAEAVGYHPQVILAGRRINDHMGAFVAQKLVKLMIGRNLPVKDARVGVLGLTFKENVPDLRNSRVPDILNELRQFGIEPAVHDPLASMEEARHEYDVELSDFRNWSELDGLILAVPHRAYLDNLDELTGVVKKGGVLIDVKSVLEPGTGRERELVYWSL